MLLKKRKLAKFQNYPPNNKKIASIILEEIASEKRWDDQFAGSQDALTKLASEALAEFNEGETRS